MKRFSLFGPGRAVLLAGLLFLSALHAGAQPADETTVSGTVVDAQGEPLMGVAVRVQGTGDGHITDVDGHFHVTTRAKNPSLEVRCMSFVTQVVPLKGRRELKIVMLEDESLMQQVVVTAMGIQRKESSLTYATQRVQAKDLTQVADPSVATTLEGRVAGLTVTPNASGAGGASKIVLRGMKSIYGNSQPLIVIDGIPMQNAARAQRGMDAESGFGQQMETEGSDPLSMINPDDIESVNVLKGANAAALYGSQAANGVVMISTKHGREGKIGVSYTSNVTFSSPLLTPRIQKVYGAAVPAAGLLGNTGWGPRIDSQAERLRTTEVAAGLNWEQPVEARLRNYARDEVAEFLRTGVTTHNAVSVQGGTERMNTYLSLANAHANGMMPRNVYNRNSVFLRQAFRLWDRLSVDASVNFAQSQTRNRPGGGRSVNPLYHLYTIPQNLDMEYYAKHYAREGAEWLSNPQDRYREEAYLNPDGSTGSAYVPETALRARLSGTAQNWPYMWQYMNNPYWLAHQNTTKDTEERLFATLDTRLDVWRGISLQMRLNIDQNRYHTDWRRAATTYHDSDMEDYGAFRDGETKRTDLYTDFLAHYDGKFGQFHVNATAGMVGHTSHTGEKITEMSRATFEPRVNGMVMQLPTLVNYFDVRGADEGATTYSEQSNWDKAALVTAQVGWKDAVYVDASYRQDWWRPFRIFKKWGLAGQDSFGHFGVGASVVASQLARMPQWISHLKWRASYSQVGNSIPNIDFFKTTVNLDTGASTGLAYGAFPPTEEENRSFETGVEALFLRDRLSLDFTYYNAVMDNLYMERKVGGLTVPVNSARVRNQGFELTVGHNARLSRQLTWRTALNVAYNSNRLERTAYDDEGRETVLEQNVEGMVVQYREGGSIGDMYASDYVRDADGRIHIKENGKVAFATDGRHQVYMGNMYSKWQLGWSHTFSFHNFALSLLINGRVGGKVVSVTEAVLDKMGFSQRSADARLAAEASGLLAPQGSGTMPGMYLPDGSGRVVPVQSYYESVSTGYSPLEYTYDATNFRLRELSLSYSWPHLFGENKGLGLSLVGRNLFFIYNASPVDPDVAFSTATGHEGFELFSMPSARTVGLTLKANF